MIIACPNCKKKTKWEGNTHRPFCSERCKRIDLGHWAEENYRVPGLPTEIDHAAKIEDF